MPLIGTKHGNCLAIRRDVQVYHEQQRSCVARVLVLRPRFIVLDEPTSAISQPATGPVTQNILISLIMQKKISAKKNRITS